MSDADVEVDVTLNEAEKTYWVRQGDGWVQGALIYLTGSVPGQITFSQPEPGHLLFKNWSPNERQGDAMSWEAVDFLLLRLGFTRELASGYAVYTYKGLTQYTFTLLVHGDQPWADRHVREVVSYAHRLITQYETEHQPPTPAAAPKPEFEAEDW